MTLMALFTFNTKKNYLISTVIWLIAETRTYDYIAFFLEVLIGWTCEERSLKKIISQCLEMKSFCLFLKVKASFHILETKKYF